jgi:hypothetical protein
MVTSTQWRTLTMEYKDLARRLEVSKDRAFILNNIARSLAGLATQLDMLAAKTREESKAAPQQAKPKLVSRFMVRLGKGGTKRPPEGGLSA